MPKYTMLEMVQRVGRSINADEISTLHETIEADDIQTILMDMLDDVLIRQDWEFLKDRPVQLAAGADVISLAIPATVSKIQKVKYETLSQVGGIPTYRTLAYLPAEQFIDKLQRNNPAEAGVDTVTVSGVPLYPNNNRAPRFWTSFDELNVYFDSYEATVDASGIDATKSAAIVTVYADLTGFDDPNWVAPIPEKMFTLWYQEAVAEASVKLRQFQDPRAERRAKRMFVSNSRDEPVTKRDDGSQEVHYGR